MQSLIWKLGALLGVVGIGFLVLMKAQSGMSIAQQEHETEQFSEVEAIEELGTLTQTASSDNGNNSADDAAGFADPFTAAEIPPDDPASEAASHSSDIEPTVAVREETTPSRASQPPAPPVADDDQSNPFAAFSGPSTPDAPPQSEPAHEPHDESADDAPEQQNPFLNLVNSSAGNAETSEPTAAPTEPVALDAEANDSTDDPLENFDPFGGRPDESLSDSNPDHPLSPRESDSFATILPQEDELVQQSSPATEPSEELPSDSAGQPGPLLMPPPSRDGVDDLAAPEIATVLADEEEPDGAVTIAEEQGTKASVTSQGATPAVEPSTEVDDQPSPFLVFPGAQTLDRTAKAESMPEPAPPATTTLPPAELFGLSDRREMVKQESVDQSAPAETAGEDEIVHADGTIEMTIKSRSDDDQKIRPAQYLDQDDSPAAGPFHPSPGNPEYPLASPANRSATSEAVTPPGLAPRPRPRFENENPAQEDSARPLLPDASQLPKVQRPAAVPTIPHALTRADYIGVGTVSEETPSTPQQAQLTIQKQAPADAVLGQDLIYSIHVKNIGQSQAKNVVVEDLVPKGSELKGTDPQAQMTPDKKLLWKLGTMEPGAQRTIRIKVVPIQAGQIGSVATVTFEAAVASRTTIMAPQLQLEMQGPQEVRIGEKAPFVFTLSNVGTADASNVFIRSILPTGFQHPAANEKNDIEYEVGQLKRGESRQVELTLLAVSEGQFQNHAILSADGDVSVESHHPIRVIPSRLKVSREGPANRFVGREARFTSTLTNESRQTLRNVIVTETIPSGLRFVSASEGGSFNTDERTVIWQIPALEPGGARRFETICVADQPGPLESKIQARDEQGDLAEASSRTTVAGFSSLTVDVTNPGRPIPVGEELALRLKIRNGGTAAASHVQTLIELPPELRFISVRGPVNYSQQGKRIVFQPIDQIDIQSEQSFDIVLAAAQATEDARVVVKLTSSELAKPLSEEESVVIFAEGE